MMSTSFPIQTKDKTINCMVWLQPIHCSTHQGPATFHEDGFVILLIFGHLRQQRVGMQTQRGLPQRLADLATPGPQTWTWCSSQQVRQPSFTRIPWGKQWAYSSFQLVTMASRAECPNNLDNLRHLQHSTSSDTLQSSCHGYLPNMSALSNHSLPQRNDV